MSETFGCCSSYKECSDAWHCIKIRDSPEHKDCQYKKNLDAGKNFYSKYVICEKSSSWWSYKAKADRAQRVTNLLKQAGIELVTKPVGRCNSRVLVELDDKVYVIYNPGSKLMPEQDARVIAGKLKQFALARAEVIGMGAPHRDYMPIPKAQEQTQKIKKVEYKQISIFDMIGEGG